VAAGSPSTIPQFYQAKVSGNITSRSVLVTNSSNVLEVGQITGGGPLALYAGTSEFMRVDTTGNVGVGTTIRSLISKIGSGIEAGGPIRGL